jgi:hypothetical protein
LRRTGPDQLPNRLELRPGPLKWGAVLAISLGFVGLAAFVGPSEPVVFYGSGGFFLLCGVTALTQMFGGGSRLVLERDGFTCVTPFRSWGRRWSDVSEFRPLRVSPFNVLVGFDSRSDLAAHPAGSAAAVWLTGATGGLPDTYGMSAKKLTELMNRFRERALAEARR